MSDAWGGSWSAGNSSCVDGVCGTGEWTGALPGDPGNNSTIAANAAYGGINVSWTYPALNPYAVIHTRLYRGITNNFSESVMQHIVSGSSFFDKIPKEQIRQYFYWIELVSVNSTVGAPIGPASATPLAAIDETLQDLYGRIDDGFLANSLRDKIGTLDILNRDLGAEIVDRIANNEALVAALAAVQSETGEAMSYILNETTERITVDSAMIDQLNVLAVGMNDNAAAIVTERLVRIDDIESLASDVNILYTTFDENTAAILDERTARTTADGALATSLSVLAAENDTLGAAIQTEQQARVSADSALSSQITTAQTVLGSNLASVQTNLQSQITTTNGKVTNIGALYTAKVSVNGLVGGFGIYNNGTEVQAGFDVDTFWIGRTASNKTKPFVISGDVVYLDKARIRDADIGTLKIAGNAITVPVSTAYNSFTGGAGVYVNAAVLTITATDSPMNIIGMFAARAGYVDGLKTTGYRVVKDGSVLVDYGSTNAFMDFPSFHFAATVAANTTSTFSVQFWGTDSTVSLGYRSLVLLGVKR